MNENETLKIRVGLVEDHTMPREAIREFLNRQPNLIVVGEAAGGDEAIQMYRAHLPDVLVLDLVLAGSAKQGVDVIEELNREFSDDAKILALTAYDVQQVVIPAIRAGAKGFVLKTAELERLVNGIVELALGRTYYTDVVKTMAIKHLQRDSPADFNILTRREREVADRLMKGMSNQQIAGDLVITKSVVKQHVNHIFRKLNISKRDDVWRRLLADQIDVFGSISEYSDRFDRS